MRKASLSYAMIVLIAAAGPAAAQWREDGRAGAILRNAGETAQDAARAAGEALKSGAAITGAFVGDQMQNAGSALSRTARRVRGDGGPGGPMVSPPGEEPDVPWAYGLGD